MDLDRSQSSCRPNIWPNNCGRPGWWFSKKTDFQNRKSEARLGKPPSLLRLSSTGDSVVEDTAEFRTINPSNFQRSGFEPVDPCAKSNTAASGIFDQFRKIAFSATGCGINSSRGSKQTAAMNLMRGSETSLPLPPDQTDQVNLEVLTAKFDHRKIEMERSGQHHQGNMQFAKQPEQGGVMMNGYVEQGIYHPYARNVENRPSSQAFRCFNFTPHYHHHRHPHPYLRRNDLMPKQRTSLHQCTSLTDPRTASDTPRSRVMDHSGVANNQKRTVLQCQMSVPSVGPYSTTQTPLASYSIAFHMQGPANHQNMQQSNAPCCGHRDQSGRNPVMKTQTNMTHQNKSQAKSTGSSHHGCSHQIQRPSPGPRATMPQPNRRCHVQKPVKHPRSESPIKTKPKKQDSEGRIQTCKVQQDLKESEKKSDILESVTTDVNLAGGEIENQNGKISDPEPNLQENQTLQQTGIASPPVDFEQLETDCCVPEAPSQSTKSEDNETINGNSVSMVTVCTKQPGSNQPQDCVTQAVEEHHEDEPVASIADGDNLPVHIQSISTSPSLKQIPSSEVKIVSSDSPNSKPLHSSLAFILSETVANDSDFSDSDWDSTATSPPSSDSWDFLKCWDDPYNPLYGWKCAKRTDQQGNEKDADTGKADSSFADDEIDSGISSLHLQQDETEEASAEDSDSWDEEESVEEQSSGELCQLWKSFCSTDDPYNPLNGWMCESSKPRTENTTTTSQKPITTQVQLKTELRNKPLQSRTATPPECLNFQAQGSQPTPKSLKLHPSVLFILGIDESDSDNALEDEDDFDDAEEDKPDKAWELFQTSGDPYSPLHGWKLQSPPSKELPKEPDSRVRPVSLSLITTTDCNMLDSPERATRRKSAIASPTVPETKPSLKRASSTGCLWIPCGGQGQKRPNINKKVHFCEASPTVISFEVSTWSNEYSDSRKGPWQEMARDRCRFMDRIRSTEAQIGHVFTPEHRLKVQQRLQINE